MAWRQRLDRAARRVVLSLARALRGEAEEDRPAPTALPDSGSPEPPEPVLSAVEKESAPPAWGLTPSQIPARVTLLPGRSSRELLRRSRSLGGRAFACYAVVVALAFLTPAHKGAIALVAMVALMFGSAIYAVVGESWVERAKLERGAGYTVWRRGTRWKPQVDADTGFVIRPAGAAELTEKQERTALRRVREIALYLDDR
jgi:hypothetical protein